MNPEQWFPIIVEGLPVEFLVLLVGAILRRLRPERMRIVQKLRTPADFVALLRRRLLRLSLLPVRLLLRVHRAVRLVRIIVLNRLVRGFLFFLLFRRELLDHHIVRTALRLPDRLGIRGGLIAKINLVRHEGAVFLNRLLRLVVIGKFHAVIGQMQCDGRARLCAAAAVHCIGIPAVALPVHRLSALLIAERIDLHVARDHEHGIEAEAKMSDDLIARRLVLVFLKEVLCAGEGDIIDIFPDLVRCHTQSVIRKRHRLLVRIDGHIDAPLIIVRQLTLTHQRQLLPFRDGIAPVGDDLTDKNIMVGIQPLLDDGKHIFTVYGKIPLFRHTHTSCCLFISVPIRGSSAQQW